MPLGQGLAGAATGMAVGGPIGAGIFGLAGLLGLGGQHEDPVMRQQRAQQQQIANQLLGYANSVPGSSPDEMFNLSQARGNLGQAQRQNQQRAFSAYNPSQGLPAAQMLANLGNTNIAQQMALQSGMLGDASANRRKALMDAANVGQGAANLYRPQQSQFPAMAGQLAQLLAYQQARNKGGTAGTAAATPTGGVPGDVPTTGPGPVNGPNLPIDWQAVGASGALGSPAGGGTGEASDWPGDPGAAIQSLTGGPAMGGVPGGAMGGLPPGVDISQLLALLSQHFGGAGMGAAQAPGQPWQSPGLQGSMSPGNESLGGMNGTMNQIRQPLQIPGIPTATPGMLDAGKVNELLRQLIQPTGVKYNF